MKERIMSMVELHLKMDEDEKNEKGDSITIIPIYAWQIPTWEVIMTEKEKLFIEYKFDGIELIGWQEFVNKWKLKIITNCNQLC